MNHYPRHIGDWMRDTAHLTDVEECIYSRLTDQYYAREGALPVEIAQCIRLARARTPQARKAVEVVLPEFFVLQNDGWHQKRCDEELTAYRERSESAKRSVNARWNKRNTNVQETNDERNTSHKPVASSHKPETKSVAEQPPKSKPFPGGEKSATRDTDESSKKLAARATWDAYSEAYQARYRAEPVRNAKVNTAILALVSRLSHEEAPHVAAFFLRNNKAFYVERGHCVDDLLRDCEKLRTEWAVGRSVTSTEARQMDRTAATGNVFNKLIQEAKNGTQG